MHVVDFNTALQELFPQKEIIVGLDLAELLHLHSKLLRLLQRQQENSDFMYTGFADRVHRVSTELIMAGQGVPARLIMFRDLSTDSRMEGVLRLIIEDTAEDVGEDFYRSLTRSLALVLSTKYAMVAVTDTKNEGQMNTLAFWNGEDHQQDFSYPLAGAPSEEILRRGSCKYTEGVAGRFPQDKVLADMGVESYLGTSLFSHDGIPVGVLAVMDIGLFKYTELAASVLEIFGIRAATEIERRQNEVRIENSEKSYRQIVETTGDGVCVVDGEGVIEFVNAPMEALLATDREALVGEVFVDQFILEREVGEKVASLEDGTLEFKMINRREDERWVVASKKAIRPSEGVAAGVLYMFSDCTEQHLLAAENKAIEEQLRHAQKLESLGVLAGGVAHDFNNLLMPIVGYVELIRRRASKDEQVAKYLQRIETAGEKLADLCNQMLTYSGKGHFVESVVDVNELVVEMQDLVRASIPNNISLTYFVKDNLPLVKVDTTQISQVIMNLVLNASEATGKNQEGKVKVSTGEAFLDDSSQESLYVADKLVPGNYVYFEVEDQGVGITTEDQERLFEPFYTTKFTGRGLGMAVVFGIVRAHKGAIEVNSEVGYGSRIRVYFPVTPGLVELSDATGDDKPHDSLQGRGRVLVVDDEAYVREILSGMLQDMGLEVIEAADGEAGMQAYLENRIELAACIIDLTMPGMNGNDLAAGIMEKDSDFPIILVSGYSQKDVSSSLLSSPNIMFMQKPITFPQFSSAMSHQLKAVAAGRNVR
jgi:PAS domain S-box-containing protein